MCGRDKQGRPDPTGAVPQGQGRRARSASLGRRGAGPDAAAGAQPAEGDDVAKARKALAALRRL
eukprot:2546452-Pyramimonas_sp.AAC.1